MTGICNEKSKPRVVYARYTAINGFDEQNFTRHLAKRMIYSQLSGLAGATSMIVPLNLVITNTECRSEPACPLMNRSSN